MKKRGKHAELAFLLTSNVWIILQLKNATRFEGVIQESCWVEGLYNAFQQMSLKSTTFLETVRRACYLSQDVGHRFYLISASDQASAPFAGCRVFRV